MTMYKKYLTINLVSYKYPILTSMLVINLGSQLAKAADNIPIYRNKLINHPVAPPKTQSSYERQIMIYT